MYGFIAQLAAEHRTGIAEVTGSNPEPHHQESIDLLTKISLKPLFQKELYIV